MIIELAAETIGITLAVFAVSLGMVGLVAGRLRDIDGGAEPDDGDPGSGGGGNKRRPDPPLDPGGEPAWWPEFERDLAEYVTRVATPSR